MGNAITTFYVKLGGPPPELPVNFWWHLVVFAVIIISFVLGVVMFFIWYERRFIGRLQVRPGPNRAGPFGLLQPVADVMKVLTKEDMIPAKADKFVFWLAPVVAFFPALAMMAVVPFQEGAQLADLNIGILYIIAISSVSSIGIFMAGWASNNKYSIIGAMRDVAQLISYEIPLVLSIIGVVLLTGSLSLGDIVAAQDVPFILLQPLGFLIFFIGSLAEMNRTPFDLLEADSEIVAGYNIEYSGMKFATFFLVEYAEALIASTLIATLFLGGWRGPLLPPFLWLLIKVIGVFTVIVWIRGTIPRLRIDQVMGFAWKFLLPLALINIMITGAEVVFWPSAPVWISIVVGLALAFLLVFGWSKVLKPEVAGLRFSGFGNGILKGMGVTVRHVFRRTITTQYPEQRLTVSRRIRGNVLAWSKTKCAGCYTCERSCPTRCIQISTAPNGHTGIVPAPCTQTCPAHVDAARYIRCLIAGKPGEAVAVVRERIPFPSVCAYICAHPCEGKCNRGQLDEPIAIRMLKRFAVDNDDGIWKKRSKMAPATGKKVAVIGAGPAGLSAAYYLAKLGGHSVTIFEALPKPGGMMRYGIPRYRLPQQRLDNDIREIENIGAKIETGRRIDKPEDLLEQGFQAVFVSIGAHQAIGMGIEGEDNPHIYGGIDLLREVSLGRKVQLGNRVAVVGGGNSAMDSARTAVRLGAKEVSIIYRRTRSEMPASPDEIKEALDEGVKFMFLVAPTKVETKDGKLELGCIRMKLGAEDASGRRKPDPVPGSEFILELDSVIAAIGQKPNLSKDFGLTVNKNGIIQADAETLATDKHRIFAGGDAVLGPATVIQCIAAGRQAAVSIDKYLGGNGNIDEVLAEPEKIIDRKNGPREDFRPEFRAIHYKQRLSGFDGVELPWDNVSAQAEASRCLGCDLVYDIEHYRFNGGLCIYCGLCVESCPFDALFMGYTYERASYRLAEQTLDKENLLTPEVKKASAYDHPEMEKDLPEQTLLINTDPQENMIWHRK